MSSTELIMLADELETILTSLSDKTTDDRLKALDEAARSVGKAASGSWLGYQSRVYYRGLTPPPPGANFSIEWGLMDTYMSSFGSRGDWEEFDPEIVTIHVKQLAKSPDLSEATSRAKTLCELFDTKKAEAISVIVAHPSIASDTFLQEVKKDISDIDIPSKAELLNAWKPSSQIMTRDQLALGQGLLAPPHVGVLADVAVLESPGLAVKQLAALARRAGSHLARVDRKSAQFNVVGTNVFIGHGRSPQWKELRDFIRDRVRFPWDEFNRVPVAGIPTIVRLTEMLESAAVALLVMTAEDELADGKVIARQNVIHEAGLFQGKLGFTRAIVLLEDGCEEFSNIFGIGQIRFPKGNIAASFEDVRRVLERENLIRTS